MKTKIVSLIVALLMLSVASCTKKQAAAPQPATQSQSPVARGGDSDNGTQVTLSEFVSSCTDPGEQAFFANTAISDHSSAFAQADATPGFAWPKIRVRFKWAGPHGEGCSFPLGVCVIINFLVSGPTLSPADLIESDASSSNGQLFIRFAENAGSNFGLTTDGYMPILYDVEIPAAAAQQLGIDAAHAKVKAGIYKAYFDATQQRYTGIALNLVD